MSGRPKASNALQCALCGRGLPEGRKRRRFCNAGCRYRAWRKAHQAEKTCAYCGALAEVVDHVPALCVRQAVREAGGSYAEVTVPSCRECGAALGAEGFTLAARRALAGDAIERKYRDLQGPEVLKAWVAARLARCRSC